MNTPQPAAFRFENYRIVEFSYSEPSEEGDKGLAVQISPSGFYFPKQKRFVLQLEFESKVNPEESKQVMRALLQAVFIFEDNITEMPDYFYKNSIAIVFPFLRAFVSTLTLQANATQLILPIANLTYLEQPLRQNTQIIVED